MGELKIQKIPFEIDRPYGGVATKCQEHLSQPKIESFRPLCWLSAKTDEHHHRKHISHVVFARLHIFLVFSYSKKVEKFNLSWKLLVQLFNYNSTLLHSCLNPDWHFWLSTRFSCCLKMKSAENILGYIRENLWNCSRNYTKIFKTDSFLGKKLSSNQNVWRDHVTMQQDVLLHFWVIFLYWNQAEIWKKYSVVQL